MLPLPWFVTFCCPSSLIKVIFMKNERESAIIELLGQIGLARPPKLIEDLYNGVSLYEVLLTMYSNI